MIGIWQGKPWGWTAPLYLSREFEFWTAHVLAGGYSSRHMHDLKTNRLYSRDAVLMVTTWENDRPQEHLIGFGEIIDVPPGTWHRFEVLQSGRIFESYWGHCDTQDIVRLDANGWRPPLAVA